MWKRQSTGVSLCTVAIFEYAPCFASGGVTQNLHRRGLIGSGEDTWLLVEYAPRFASGGGCPQPPRGGLGGKMVVAS